MSIAAKIIGLLGGIYRLNAISGVPTFKVPTVSGAADVFSLQDSAGNVFFSIGSSGATVVRQNINDQGNSGGSYTVVMSTGRTIVSDTGSLDFRASVGGAVDVSLYRVAAGVLGTGVGQTTSGGWLQHTAGAAVLNGPFTENAASLTATPLSFTVKSGRSYQILGCLQVSNSTAGEGIKFDFNGGSAGATTFFMNVSAIGTVVAGTVVSVALATTMNYTSLTGTDYLILHGYLKPSGNGTFILRAAENSHATGTLTVGAGSWMALADAPAL